MQKVSLSAQQGFQVVARSPRSEAAVMVLGPGESTGGPDNTHRKSDQWLLVLSGRGKAVVDGKLVPLEPNTLLLIEAGETHEIATDGKEPLQTLNLYAPPEY